MLSFKEVKEAIKNLKFDKELYFTTPKFEYIIQVIKKDNEDWDPPKDRINHYYKIHIYFHNEDDDAEIEFITSKKTLIKYIKVDYYE